jgi:membrane-associated phospholipid phosphatase
MLLPRNQYISFNQYFLFPFLFWVIAGGILLINFNAEDMFFYVNTHNTPLADTLLYYTTWMGEGYFIIPVLLLVLAWPAYRNWWYVFTAILCNLIPFFIQQSLKSFFDAPRPLNYFHHATWIHLSPNWPVLLWRSYPSGHSEGAFCFFCFLSLLLPVRYRGFGLAFFILAMAVGYSRVYLAAHFFADVYTGSIIGAVMCTLIYSVMDKLKDRFYDRKGTFI